MPVTTDKATRKAAGPDLYHTEVRAESAHTAGNPQVET